MTRKGINILAYLSILLILGCTDERASQPEQLSHEPSLTFVMTRSLEDIIGNTQVYLFDGEGAETDQFNHKVMGVTYHPDRLSMSIEEGWWNIMLVSANEDITAKLTQPVRGEERGGKMWETRPVSGILPSIPELRTAYVTGNEVIAEQDNQAGETAVLTRNAALVKVVIVDAGGLNVNGTHTLEISNVPTTLSWEGKLLPNKDNPYVSSSPMMGNFVMHNHASGDQYSDTLSFIIPAHKGIDYLDASPTDTTTNELRLSIDMAYGGGGRYVKRDVAVPRVPRVNGTLLIRLSLSSELEVSAEILNWEDTHLNTGLIHTTLSTDKASVGLSYKDTLHVNTNAADFAVEKSPAATWMTVTKIGGDAIEIAADRDTYAGSPRTSYITVKANNITKKIPVTQRPDEGTISVSNKRLVFCPLAHETRTAAITSLGGDWEFVSQTDKATPDVQQGVNGTCVTFTRASTDEEDDFDQFYGDDILVVKNKQTLDTDTIEIVNCFIYAYDNIINANAPTGSNQTAVTTTQDVVVYGGSRNLSNFTSPDSWIYGMYWNMAAQTLSFTTGRDPDDEARTGSMSFQHIECSDYVVNLQVYQDIIITVPLFDYFVMTLSKPTTSNTDFSMAVAFAGNHVSGDGTHNQTYDNRPVGGGGLPGAITYKSQPLLQWSSEGKANSGQNAFFNAPVFQDDNDSPRKIRLDIYAAWGKSNPNATHMQLQIDAYLGGTMSLNSSIFVNTGGGIVFTRLYKFPILTLSTRPNNYATEYLRVATIIYDRAKHTAVVTMHVEYTVE